ncbi:hypothetical protein ACM66B_005841 [Microbotryomycetes sp. NB124-2]
MSADSQQPVNPLLSRGKLKKASKPKSKTKAKGNQPASTSQATSSGTSTPATLEGDAAAAQTTSDGNGNEVDDLADQLLAQLDARDSSGSAAGQGASQPQLDEHHRPTVGGRSASGGGHDSSGGHSHSAREKLHDMKEGVKDVLLPNHKEHHGHSTSETERVSRQKARKLKKEQHYENMRRQAEEEMLAENDRSVQDERDAIEAGCSRLNVRVKEINPDGHCLYSAIADQVNMLGLAEKKEDYSSVRTHAAEIMRQHPDDFLPFLPSEVNDDEMMSSAEYAKYCNTVQNTAEWGGEPEINALSKYYKAPIHVLQAGTDLVKVGEEYPANRGPILISYHRKMYGLGEHYNSLRPATYSGSV